MFPSMPTRSDEPPAKPAPPTLVADEASVAEPPVREAAPLSAMRTERLGISQVFLPQAYLDLGKAIHSTQQYRHTFPDLHAKIDESFQRIRQLKQGRPANKSVRRRAKLVPATARNAACIQAVFAKLADQFRALGKAAYEQDGPSSGPAHFTSAIAEHLRQIAALDAEIAGIEQPQAGRALAPRRILIGGACAFGLVLLFCWMSRNGFVASGRDSIADCPRTEAAQTLPAAANSAYKVDELRDLAAVARSGVAASRMLKLRRQRSAANYASLVKEVDDFRNGTIGCPKEWIDLFRMWQGPYTCLEGVPIHVIEVTGPNEFVAEGFSPESSGKRVVMRGWNTTGFVDDQRRSLSGVSYFGGKTAAYGTVLGASRTGDLIEKVHDEIVRYVIDSLLKPAPK